MSTSIDTIYKDMIDRYSIRYKEMGYNVKTLGWGTTEQQQYRFKQAIKNVDFDTKTVVDIGCGFGDFLALLIAEKIPVNKYIGWDINPDLIAEATKIWSNEKVATSSLFEVINIGKHTPSFPIADIGFMFGVLNLNFKGAIDNYEYSKQFIRNAFSAVKDVLVVDFLSNQLTPDYPKEDFVFYHDPAKMLEFALGITPNVVLTHNYAPIPQKEFMLFLYK